MNPSKKRIKEIMDEVETLDLSDGAHWALVHEKLDLKYGKVFDLISDDPEYFGFKQTAQ